MSVKEKDSAGQKSIPTFPPHRSIDSNTKTLSTENCLKNHNQLGILFIRYHTKLIFQKHLNIYIVMDCAKHI